MTRLQSCKFTVKNMELTKRLDEFNTSHDMFSGGKGKSLSFLLKHNILVPNGFVVLSNAFEEFILQNNLSQKINLILEKVNKDKMDTIEFASEKIKSLILNSLFPFELENNIKSLYKELGLNLVAVRSSATLEDGFNDAWAGQLESYLNTEENALINNIRRCWASLYTSRAIFYRFQKKLHLTSISVAVVIQEMIQSEVSGIAFSVHPITQNVNELIIEAGFGLGEAIVSGKITPDSYTVRKDTLEIVNIYTNEQKKKLILGENNKNIWENICIQEKSKSKLNNEQIIELSKIVINIEKLHNYPQDIEWAFREGKFYIVQSRPITTLV